jgi:hypothetical protein
VWEVVYRGAQQGHETLAYRVEGMNEMKAELPSQPRSRWSRLLLESIAIVLSILLAFAIDAGWDERQDRRAEEEILRALSVEFEGYKDGFIRRSEFYQETADQIVWLLDEAEFIPSEAERLDRGLLAFVGALSRVSERTNRETVTHHQGLQVAAICDAGCRSTGCLQGACR